MSGQCHFKVNDKSRSGQVRCVYLRTRSGQCQGQVRLGQIKIWSGQVVVNDRHDRQDKATETPLPRGT